MQLSKYQREYYTQKIRMAANNTKNIIQKNVIAIY